MDRRLLTVVATSLLVALVLSAVFYQVVMGARRGGPRAGRMDLRDVVVAARALPFGITLKPADVKLAKFPVEQVPADGFGRLEEVLERPVISNILADEPVRAGRLALRGSGMGLAPIIPPGMRAVAVRVNDVAGVAGYVLPGMRVDVLVTDHPAGRESAVTKTILQDIQVLSAGQNIDPDGPGKAINTPVVTLLVTPAQAETLTLGSEGRIQLVLRNSSDRGVENTPGRVLADLFPTTAERPKPEIAAAPRRAAPPPPAAHLARVTEDVVVIRGNLRTVEQVAIGKSE
jgi:pilus assembly protein CpaB